MSLLQAPSLLCPNAQSTQLPYKSPSSLQAAQNDLQPAAEIASSTG